MNLKQDMPTVYAWLADLRDHFGKDAIMASVKNGLAGGTDIFATENGHQIGNQKPPGRTINASQMVLCSKTPDPASKTAPRRRARGLE